MRSLFSLIVKHKLDLFFSIVFSAALAVGIYILFLQHPILIVLRDVSIALTLWLILIPILFFIFITLLTPAWGKSTPKTKTLILCGSLIMALFSVLQINGFKQLYLTILLPQHSLDILATATHETYATDNTVEIATFNYGRGELNLKQFSAGEGWDYKEGKWIFSGEQAAHLRWQGRIIDQAALLMLTGPQSGRVQITWDQETFDYSLYSAQPGEQLFSVTNAIPPAGSLVAWFIIFLVCFWLYGFIFCLYLHWLRHQHIKEMPTAGRPAVLNLFFLALPMLVVWGTYQAVYFPAVMTNDSMAQWQQAVSGQFSDWHPFIHTLLLWATLQIEPTPALFISIQIFIFGLISAWGLNKLVGQGLPFGFALFFSFMFALSPVNGIYAVTIWKDVPYGIMLLCLVIQLFCIISSEGRWLDKGINQLALAVCSFLVMLLRHNGVPIPLLSIVAVLLVYRSQWRALLNSLFIAVLLYFSFTGPVYTLFNVQKTSEGLENTILLHHIGAHVQAGTPFSTEDRQFLDEMMPLPLWQYDCCGVNSLYYTPNLNKEIYNNNGARLQTIFMDALLSDPQVDVNHLLCASSIVYSTHSSCYNYASGLILKPDQVHWIEDRNTISENSLLPQLVTPLTRYVTTSSSEGWVYLFWRPALSLGIDIFILILILLTAPSLKWALLGLPLVLQSAIMLLINLAQDFRYHFSIGLVTPFLLAVLIWQIFRHITLPVPRGQDHQSD